MTTASPAASPAASPGTSPATRPTVATGSPVPTTTRRLLACGVASGPLWAAVSFAQAATRDGYSFTREPLSMLSTGALGWLQITNFVVTGVLVVLGAVGLRRACPHDRRPANVATVQGVALVAAGLLVMDPPGAPAGSLSWHAAGHMLAGSVCFAALAVLGVLWARRFARAGRPVSAVLSVVVAVGVVAGNAWAIGGGHAGSVTIAVGTVAAMLWSSVVHAGHRGR